MAVIQSVGKKVDCNIDAKCWVQSFKSSKCYSMFNIIASWLFAYILACKIISSVWAYWYFSYSVCVTPFFPVTPPESRGW